MAIATLPGIARSRMNVIIVTIKTTIDRLQHPPHRKPITVSPPACSVVRNRSGPGCPRPRIVRRGAIELNRHY